MRTTALLLPALLAAGLLTGCSDGGEPAAAPDRDFRTMPASSFTEGTCSLVAEDVLELGRQGARLDEAPTVDPAVTAGLETAQDRLAPVAETAEPTLKPPLDKLVVTAGLVRLTAAAEKYDPQLGKDLATAYDAVLDACTATG